LELLLLHLNLLLQLLNLLLQLLVARRLRVRRADGERAQRRAIEKPVLDRHCLPFGFFDSAAILGAAHDASASAAWHERDAACVKSALLFAQGSCARGTIEQ
jgi:hypothetical protein